MWHRLGCSKHRAQNVHSLRKQLHQHRFFDHCTHLFTLQTLLSAESDFSTAIILIARVTQTALFTLDSILVVGVVVRKLADCNVFGG